MNEVAAVPRDDALAEVLRSVRLETSLMTRARLASPWAVSSNGTSDALFHAIVEGGCHLRGDDGSEVKIDLEPGDVALLPNGDAHTIYDREGQPPAQLSALVFDSDGTCVPELRYGGNGTVTRIICGTFSMRHPAADGMLSILPAVLHVSGSAIGQWLETTIVMLADELDNNSPTAAAVVTRLTDVLVMHVLRSCVEAAPDRGGGWLSALRDERIGRALASIHRDPGADWTAGSLASTVGMSRSSFFARFSELVGEPPARYVTRWRMWVAVDLMTEGSLSLGQLAERVGYASEDAFSRTFKRHMGVSPGQYRRGLAHH